MVDGGAIIDVFANSINVGSGFRLRCKWNRFLFMTEYRTDGRRSVSAGHSSLLPFSLSLSLSPLLSASMSPCSFLETCRFFTNTQHRRTKEALYLGKRWEPETFCYIVSIYRYPFRENCRVTGEFVARIDNRRTLRKIRLKHVIRGSKLSVVVLNLVSSCWKSFLSFLFLYSVIIHSRSFAFFVVYLFPVSGSKVKLKI